MVVLKDSSPVLMPWIDKAPAILEAWNQGTEDGHVVADLLFGVVNPGGKVPTTYPAPEQDTLYHNDPVRYPGTDEGGGFPVIRYTEGRKAGYRWFQSQGIKPLFPFGFGLSYTTFEISDLAVSPTANDGAQPDHGRIHRQEHRPVAGAEVGQVYLGIPVKGQPPKRLVGFKKVFLQPGESQRVSIVDRPGRDQPSAVGVGLLREGLRREAGRVHGVRRQLQRQHAAHRDRDDRLASQQTR